MSGADSGESTADSARESSDAAKYKGISVVRIPEIHLKRALREVRCGKIQGYMFGVDSGKSTADPPWESSCAVT